MEKKIVLMSNSKDHLIENRLNHFQNNFLDNNFLESHKKWSISVEQIGFHAQFKNEATSHGNKNPCLISATRQFFFSKSGYDILTQTNQNSVLSLDFFLEGQMFYLNENDSYSPLMIHKLFSARCLATSKQKDHEKNMLYSGLVTQVDRNSESLNFGQFRYPRPQKP